MDKLLLAFPITTFTLGIWQLKRLADKQKQSTIKTAEIEYTPLLPEFTPVFLSGKYSPDYIKVGPRPSFNHQAQNSGYLHFHLFNNVIVNRGWARGTDDLSIPGGETTIHGIVRHGESAPLFKTTPKNRTLHWIDLSYISRYFSSHTSSTTSLGTPTLIENTQNSDTRREFVELSVSDGLQLRDLKKKNNHLEYALTWAGLTIMTLAFMPRSVYRSLRRS